jgi:two-component system sensor histidine kinase FlrB
MGQMAATLAHQLRTPLATMTLYGSRLSANQLSDSDRRRLAGRLEERMRHMAAQINDMLLYARGGAGAVESFDLESLMIELLLQAQPLVERDGGVLLRRGTRLSGELCGNREALSGALLNLIDNAVSANPGGEISVATDIDNGVLTIAVSDDGPGIPSDVLPRIFEPFYTTRSSGSGLGLAVVYTVACAHGGDVQCHSSPGEGSCFKLTLPMAANHQPIASEIAAAEIVGDGRNSAETISHA